MNSQPWPGEPSFLQSSEKSARLILSVDDEQAILYTRHKILQDAGYEVVSAVDGEQALRIFASNSDCIDLVVLDYLLPGIDGGTVALEMKRRNRAVPIIVVSASPVPQDTLACVECRLDKGVGPIVLLGKVSELLGRPHSQAAP